MSTVHVQEPAQKNKVASARLRTTLRHQRRTIESIPHACPDAYSEGCTATLRERVWLQRGKTRSLERMPAHPDMTGKRLTIRGRGREWVVSRHPHSDTWGVAGFPHKQEENALSQRLPPNPATALPGMACSVSLLNHSKIPCHKHTQSTNAWC